MSSITDFIHSKTVLKNNLNNIMEWSHDLEEKYQAMNLLVETLSHSNYKKEKEIKKLKQKIQKYKHDKKYDNKTEEPRESFPSFPTITPDGKYIITYQEIVNLSEEEDEIIPEPIRKVRVVKHEPIAVEIAEEEPVEIEDIVEEKIEDIVEIMEIVEIVEEVMEDETEEPVEIAEEEPVETEIEESEEDIEPVIDPEVISEPEENQSTIEPVLEKEEMISPTEQPEEEQVFAEEEGEELYEILIGKSSYYVSNEINGPIYEITKEEEVGDEVGQFVNGKPVFQTKTPEPEEVEEEEEVELIQTKINGVNYAVENEIDGPIYSLGFDGDVEEEVGKYVKGKPTFYKK